MRASSSGPGWGRSGGEADGKLSDFAPYAAWLSEVLATLEEHKIDRITVAAPLADGEVFTGYYNMNTQDKALLASNIQADAVLDAVCHNGQRIRQAWEDDEEG